MKYKMKDLSLELALKSQLKCENFRAEITLRLKNIYAITVGGIFYIVLIVKRA